MSASQSLQDDHRKPSRLFIELDTLFDTRLAVLATMENNALEKAFKHGYYDRQSDSFPDVDYEVFKALYAKRDKSILKEAIITPVSMIARDFAVSTLNNVNNSPFHYKPVLMINIYPYKLEEEEISVIMSGARAMTKELCDIEIVDMSPVQLTPLYLKLNLAMVAIYEYDKWLEIHAVTEAWKKHTAPDVTVLAPRIAMKKLDHPLPRDIDPFNEMQKQAAPFVDLKLIAIENFSLMLKPEDFLKAKEKLDNI